MRTEPEIARVRAILSSVLRDQSRREPETYTAFHTAHEVLSWVLGQPAGNEFGIAMAYLYVAGQRERAARARKRRQPQPVLVIRGGAA